LTQLDNNIVTNNFLRQCPEPQSFTSLIASIYSLSSAKNPDAKQASLNVGDVMLSTVLMSS